MTDTADCLDTIVEKNLFTLFFVPISDSQKHNVLLHPHKKIENRISTASHFTIRLNEGCLVFGNATFENELHRVAYSSVFCPADGDILIPTSRTIDLESRNRYLFIQSDHTRSQSVQSSHLTTMYINRQTCRTTMWIISLLFSMSGWSDIQTDATKAAYS